MLTSNATYNTTKEVVTTVDVKHPRVNVRFKPSEISNLVKDINKLTLIGAAISDDTKKFMELASKRASKV